LPPAPSPLWLMLSKERGYWSACQTQRTDAPPCSNSQKQREPSSSRFAACRWNWAKNSLHHLTRASGGFCSTCLTDSIKECSWRKSTMRNDTQDSRQSLAKCDSIESIFPQ